MSSRFWLHFRKQKRHMRILSRRCQYRHIVNLFNPEINFHSIIKTWHARCLLHIDLHQLMSKRTLSPGKRKREAPRKGPLFGFKDSHYCVFDSLFLSFFGTPSRPNSSSYASKIARATGAALLEPKPPSGITTATASFGLLRGA